MYYICTEYSQYTVLYFALYAVHSTDCPSTAVHTDLTEVPSFSFMVRCYT